MAKSVLKLMVLWVAAAGIAEGATFCVQSFAFLGAGDGVLWIGEDIGGECEVSRLLCINTAGEGPTLGVFELKQPRQWGPIRSALAALRTERVIELDRREDGGFGHSTLKWTLHRPQANAALMGRFDKHIAEGGSGARSFCRSHGDYVMPVVQGAAAVVDYYYPAGLYINYTIEKGYYLPRPGVVLVFTKNEKRAVGMDSMHGFMLLKIPKEVQK